MRTGESIVIAELSSRLFRGEGRRFWITFLASGRRPRASGKSHHLQFLRHFGDYIVLEAEHRLNQEIL